MYPLLFRTVLSRMDPESAHHSAMVVIRMLGVPPFSWAARAITRPAPELRTTALGLTFDSPFGVAAGFDKDVKGAAGLHALGFGHVEVGTVTGEAQPGNPQPRLFRLPDDGAVVNRMGFNNDGADVVAARLKARGRRPVADGGPVLGVNIGKSKVVPEDEAVRDYEKSARLLAPYADYLVVNVSSPNTAGLRNLQAVEKLEPILTSVQAIADGVPLLVKIAPDLSDDDVLAVADLALAIGLDGIIATNTTISRAGLRTSDAQVQEIGAGGLSGGPLTERSLEVLTLLRGRVGPELTLIGVGGIATVADAQARLDAGATLLQGYTAFIYEGPLWPRRIVNGVTP